MTDRTDPTSPDPTSPDPGELELVERRLRRALHQEAQLMRPTDRLDDILAGSDSEGPANRGRRPGPPRWLAPLSAAAAVAVIAGTVYVVTRDDRTSAPPAASTSTHSSSAPSASPSSEPSGATSTNPSSVPAGQPAVLPVYFVGRPAATGPCSGCSASSCRGRSRRTPPTMTRPRLRSTSP